MSYVEHVKLVKCGFGFWSQLFWNVKCLNVITHIPEGLWLIPFHSTLHAELTLHILTLQHKIARVFFSPNRWVWQITCSTLWVCFIIAEVLRGCVPTIGVILWHKKQQHPWPYCEVTVVSIQKHWCMNEVAVNQISSDVPVTTVITVSWQKSAEVSVCH